MGARLVDMVNRGEPPTPVIAAPVANPFDTPPQTVTEPVANPFDVPPVAQADPPPIDVNAALAALAGPQPKTWLDTLKGAVGLGEPTAGPATPDRGIMSTVRGTINGMTDAADQAAYTARGARRGLANIVGLPVDAVNAGMSLVGAPVSTKPFMGSKSIDEALGGFGAIPEVRPPSTLTEKALGRVGEEIGASALPVGAALHAAKMGIDAARKLPILARMFVEPAAINPRGFVGREAATAGAAGTFAAGAGAAGSTFGVADHGPTHDIIDLGGALTGAGVLGATKMVGNSAKDIFNAIFRKDKFNNQVVQNSATDQIVNAATGVPKVEGKPVDTAPLVDAITGGRRVDDTIPGFKESLADRTADPGLASLEYGRMSGPNAGDFAARRGENTNAVDAAVNRSAPAPDTTPGALRSELELERGRRQGDAAVQTANAQDAFDRASQSLSSTMTGEARGADIRAALEHASADTQALVRQAWEPINRSGVHVDTAPLAEDFGGLRANMSTAEAERFRPGEANLPERLATRPDVNAAGEAVDVPTTQPIREITGLRSALTDAAREAATAGRSNEARVIGQHVDALDTYLETAVPEGLRQQYDTARAATRDAADRFSRPQTAIAQTLDRQQGQYRQPDSAVARKFVQDDTGRISDFEALMRETGHDQRTVGAVRDQILADVRDRGLLNNPQGLTDYLGRYNTILSDPRFNAVRGELDNAAGLRRQLGEATDAQAGLTRELGTAERPGTSTVGQYLRFGDERAQNAMKGVMASKEPGKATDELLSFVNDEPKAVEGARKAFWDIFQSKARSGGETTKTLDGKQPWMPNKMKEFLDDPANKAVAERLYRDNPEHLTNLDRIAAELQGVDLRNRAKAPNTSGTNQGISNILTPETLQSRFYAYKRGQTSLGFMLTALGSVVARRAVRGAQTEAIGKLVDRALLDPELAAQLLKDNNPANRAAINRSAKAYLGNEASTITDLLTGGKEDDPVKDAITR